MAIHRLNHAVLYVRDVERSTAFYRDVLGFRVKSSMWWCGRVNPRVPNSAKPRRCRCAGKSWQEIGLSPTARPKIALSSGRIWLSALTGCIWPTRLVSPSKRR